MAATDRATGTATVEVAPTKRVIMVDASIMNVKGEMEVEGERDNRQVGERRVNRKEMSAEMSEMRYT